MMKAATSNTCWSASQCWLRPARSSQQRFSTSNVAAGKRNIRLLLSLGADMLGPDQHGQIALACGGYSTVFSRQKKRVPNGILTSAISLPHAGGTDGQ